jgi:hypothetical protein
MKFKCPACGQILNRDMRTKLAKRQLRFRKGRVYYKGFCGADGVDKQVLCREVK